MSVQFGRWNIDNEPMTPQYLAGVHATLAPYGPDGQGEYSREGIAILYHAFHATKESQAEVQPLVMPSGAVMTWDGRLDNRSELIRELRTSLGSDLSDIAIAAAAYEKWGDKCFGKLIGDWALSIWNPRDQSLLLVKDSIGTNQLHYSFENNQVLWSTILDPLVLFAGKKYRICEEYVAGWLSHFPAPHLTPYEGIHAVPPASYVLLRPAKHGVRRTITKYWDFDPAKKIRYRTDADYEQHFRDVFGQAVKRRLRSGHPVLGELSGGMDSSSIVCMADAVIARGQAECPRLDTISWFDSSNPYWDDNVYFAIVEKQRGREGFHIDCAAQANEAESPAASRNLLLESGTDRLVAVPGSRRLISSPFFKKYASCLASQGGHRVVLSGIGGEQPTGGGLPTPTPELQNLMARAQFFKLVRQLNAWAARMRKPRLPLLWEAVRGFFVPDLESVGSEEKKPQAPWLDPGFLRRNHAALYHYPSRTKLFGPLPSLQNLLADLEGERRLMALVAVPTPEVLHETRYPFLDRDLREFAYAIPWEQIVRVGQRRSLMKRALVGIVPDELLKRRPKPFAPPDTDSPEKKKPSLPDWLDHLQIEEDLVASSIGLVDENRFWEAVHKARRAEKVPLLSLELTLRLESWLRNLTAQGVLARPTITGRPGLSMPVEAAPLTMHASHKGSAS